MVLPPVFGPLHLLRVDMVCGPPVFSRLDIVLAQVLFASSWSQGKRIVFSPVVGPQASPFFGLACPAPVHRDFSPRWAVSPVDSRETCFPSSVGLLSESHS